MKTFATFIWIYLIALALQLSAAPQPRGQCLFGSTKYDEYDALEFPPSNVNRYVTVPRGKGRGSGGEYELLVLVGTDGQVEDWHVVTQVGDRKVSTGGNDWVPTAVRAVKSWRFQRLIVDGEPKRYGVRVSVNVTPIQVIDSNMMLPAFNRRFWPNKSLQPTATAVMPPAAQEIMPAVAVAEH